ncbi:MAG: LysR family transcriptional regulator [Woeseiaceae bacterium]|nr:LysR family transcriptional regulator [Woeseiaceae bacterium]
MDWRSIKFDWNRARAFLVTAEEGSLSAAARAMNMAQPTLGRQVSALEEELGVVLFERRGRGLELTNSGLELVDHVRSMAEAANRLSLSASGKSTSLEGTVCITATDITAVFVMPALIAKLRRQEPGIRIELIASNSSSDLKRREADIAIRAYRPTQADLIARKVRDIPWSLYASKDYLERLGNPTTPEGFDNADFIGFDRSERLVAALNPLGFNLTKDNFTVIAENHIAHWELLRHGVGITPMPTELGDTEPGIQRILPDLGPMDSELWLAAHRELRTTRRIRTVFDFLATELADYDLGRLRS